MATSTFDFNYIEVEGTCLSNLNGPFVTLTAISKIEFEKEKLAFVMLKSTKNFPYTAQVIASIVGYEA